MVKCELGYTNCIPEDCRDSRCEESDAFSEVGQYIIRFSLEGLKELRKVILNSKHKVPGLRLEELDAIIRRGAE